MPSTGRTFSRSPDFLRRWNYTARAGVARQIINEVAFGEFDAGREHGRYQPVMNRGQRPMQQLSRRILARVDQKREYPKAFVDAVTEAGYLAALVLEQYGGAGLGILEGSVILEEINRSGGHSGACHAQMYTMGTLLRAWVGRAEEPLPADDSLRRTSTPILWSYRAEYWIRYHEAHDDGSPQRRPLCGQWAEGIYFARRAIRFDVASQARTTPLDRSRQEITGDYLFFWWTCARPLAMA